MQELHTVWNLVYKGRKMRGKYRFKLKWTRRKLPTYNEYCGRPTWTDPI